MRIYSAIFCFVLALFVAFSPISACGATSSLPNGVTVRADSLTHDKANGSYLAEGNVEITWKEATLLADRVSLEQDTGEAVAEGNVRLIKENDTLTGEQVRVNLTSQIGEALNAELFVRQRNLHVQGARLEKTGMDDYRLERGTFTTCDGPSPSWKFTASSLNVTLEEYASGRNALFYINDTPVFYLPYIVFPVKRERQSGFLFPRIGSSTKKGFNFNIPYYWAISPSQDLTLDLDIQSKRGAGADVEYRYLRKDDSHGEIRAYFIQDTSRGRGRGELVARQQEHLAPGLTFKTDLTRTLDRSFYRDFAEASGEYNRQLLDSSVSLTKAWHSSILTGEFRYVDNLDLPSNSATLQKLPQLSFNAVRRRLGETPLYAGMDASSTNFYRKEGSRGQRYTLHPVLSSYWLAPGGLELSAWGGYRLRFYNGYSGDPGLGYHSSGLADAGATIATSLARVYEINRGALTRVRHTLAPTIGYSFVQDKGQETLPFFDYDDRVVGQQRLSWSLASYLTGRFAKENAPPDYRDLLTLRLSQGYNMSGSRRDLLTFVDDGLPFSDVRLEARISPLPLVSITTDSRFNTYQTRLSTSTLGVDTADGDGNLVGMGYHFARNHLEYLEGKVGVSLAKPLVMNYIARYSFDKGDFLESYYSLEYRHQCWSIVLSYRDRSDNREFLINFMLSGLGSVGRIKAF
ncbi:MAG: LPS assembly protein LptD [Geobacteraceae bacterium]